MTTERKSELLREPEVTREYRLSGPWLRKRRRLKKDPPFLRFDRMVYYRRADLEAFIAAHRIAPK